MEPSDRSACRRGSPCYRNQDGLVVTTATGPCRTRWASYTIKPSGFLLRIKDDQLLPIRTSAGEAQDDLDRYAVHQGFTKIQD